VRAFRADDDPHPVRPAGQGWRAGQLGHFRFLADAAVGGQCRARTFALATAMRRNWVAPISSGTRHTVVSEATGPNTSP
jgi:hypothetical protein